MIFYNMILWLLFEAAYVWVCSHLNPIIYICVIHLMDFTNKYLHKVPTTKLLFNKKMPAQVHNTVCLSVCLLNSNSSLTTEAERLNWGYLSSKRKSTGKELLF